MQVRGRGVAKRKDKRRLCSVNNNNSNAGEGEGGEKRGGIGGDCVLSHQQQQCR